MPHAASTRTTPAGSRRGRRRKPGARPQPDRAETSAESLALLKRQTTAFVRQFRTLSPEVFRALILPGEEIMPRPASGFSRDRSFDYVVRMSESMGVNQSYGRILRGAAAEFGEKGYDATSIDGILEASDVARRTFYQFFSDKGDVLDDLFDLVMEVWGELFAEAARSEAPPQVKLKRAVRVCIGGFSFAGRLIRVLLTEALRPGSPLEGRYRKILDGLTATIQPAYEAAVGREVDPKYIRAQLVAVFAIALDLNLSPASTRAELEEAQRLMIRMIAALGR